MNKLAIAVAVAAPLALVGCQSVVDQLSGQSLAAKCNRASIAYATFVASGEGSAATKRKVGEVYRTVYNFCQNPDRINGQNISVEIAKLYAALKGTI